MAPTLAIQASLVVSGVLSARLLGPELRGYLTLATLLPGVVAAVAFLGLANAIAYFTARDHAAAPNLLARSIGPASLIAIGAFIANLVLYWLFFRNDEPEVRTAVLPSLLVAPALIAQLLAAAHLQGMARYRAMNIVRVAPFVLYAAGVAACYLLQARSLSLVIWAFTLAYGSVAVMSLMIVRRSLAGMDRALAAAPRRTVIRFGLRGFAVSLSPIETFRADQLVVAALLPAAELAFYSVATAFSVLPRLLTQNLGLVASTEVASRAEAQRVASVRGILVTAVVLVGTTVVALEALLPGLIELLFGEPFLPALACARLLLLAAAALGLRRLVTDLIRGHGRPGIESISEVASWPVLVVGVVLVFGAGALGGGIEAVAAVVLAASTVSLIVAVRYFAKIMRPPRDLVTGATQE